MGRPAVLETFDDRDQTAADGDTGANDAWNAGFQAGYEAAMIDAQAQQDRLSTDIVQTLNDQAFSFFEARDHLLGTLRPLFEQLISTFAPCAAREMMVPLISASLEQMAEHLMDQPIELRVAPALGPAVRIIAGQLDTYPLRIVEDDALGQLKATISGGREARVINLESILQDVQTVLSAMTPQDTETHSHG